MVIKRRKQKINVSGSEKSAGWCADEKSTLEGN